MLLCSIHYRKAACEREAVGELRKCFRLEIQYAGTDPAYSLCSQIQQQPETPVGNSLGREEAAADGSRVSGIAEPERGSMLVNAGIVGFAEESTGVEDAGQDMVKPRSARVSQDGKCGNGIYVEPSFITRQRCITLNEWALDLFYAGNYGKVGVSRARIQSFDT